MRRPTAIDRPTAAAAVQPVVWGAVLVLAAVTLGWLIVAIGGGAVAADRPWMTWIASVRTPFGDAAAYTLNWLGGGWFATWVVPLGAAAAFLIARRPASAATFVLASLLSAGGVQALKQLFARARPEDMIVHSDFGSFPSGHVANAATIAVILALLLPRAWVIVAGVVWVLLMGWSRTYLGAHWLTDVVGGAAVGAGAALLTYVLVGAVADRARRRRSESIA